METSSELVCAGRRFFGRKFGSVTPDRDMAFGKCKESYVFGEHSTYLTVMANTGQYLDGLGSWMLLDVIHGVC